MGGGIQRIARSIFDEFVEAFQTFNGHEIAKRYTAPYFAMHVDGTTSLFNTSEDIAAYFQRVADEYHSMGCRTCQYGDLEVIATGTERILASVTWDLNTEAVSQ